MASKLHKAILHGSFYITINNDYNRQWRDFTLQRGHVFGYSPELDGEDGMTGLFVVYQEKQDSIILYVSVLQKKIGTMDRYTWYRHAIYKDSRTGEAIMPVLEKRRGGVSSLPLSEQDVSKIYNPPLLKNHYTPMPSMRIPGGSYERILSQEIEYHGDGRTMSRMKRYMRNANARIEYNRRKNNGVYAENH